MRPSSRGVTVGKQDVLRHAAIGDCLTPQAVAPAMARRTNAAAITARLVVNAPDATVP